MAVIARWVVVVGLVTVPSFQATGATTAAAPACWAARVAAADAVADGAPGHVAFAVRDPSGRMWQRNGRRRFPSVSLVKTTVLVAYLNRPGVRDRRLTLRERALLRRMITSSDNAATNVLIAALPRRAITRAAGISGQRDFVLAMPVWGLSTTSAVDQARLFARLDDSLPPRHRRFARTALRSIVRSQRWGIARVAPKGWAVMFKGGWGSGTGRITSQAARLESGGQVWSVAILTAGNRSHATGVATIERIAKRLLANGPCEGGSTP